MDKPTRSDRITFSRLVTLLEILGHGELTHRVRGRAEAYALRLLDRLDPEYATVDYSPLYIPVTADVDLTRPAARDEDEADE